MTARAGPRGGVAYGIDIGGTKVLGVALRAPDELVAEARVPTPPATDAGSVAGHVADAVAGVVERLDDEVSGAGFVSDAGPGVGMPGGVVVPVGVGVPGMVDRKGRLVFAPNLPQGQGVDWPSLLEDRIGGRPVVVENDANLAVLAEHELGAAAGSAMS